MEFAPTKKRPPHQADLRRHRISLPNECYFITTCIEDRRPIFQDPEAARILIESLRWLRDQGRIRLLGYVVMPDHLHVALALRETVTLVEVMQSFKRHTSRQIHRAVVGANCIRDSGVATASRSYEKLWQAGYYDTLLRDRKDFDKRLEYIHANPVRKGLVQREADYPFSTAHPDGEGDIDGAWLEGAEK